MSVHWGGRGAGHVSRWGEGVYPLVFNFIPAALDTRITFTRASGGTFVGSNGLIQTAAIDDPRFTYAQIGLAPLGLLIEPQRINVLQYSEDFTNAVWGSGDGGAALVTGDTAVAPTGTQIADTLNDNSGAAVLGRKNGASVTSGTSQYTASVFVKHNTSNCASIRLQLAGGTAVTGELVLDTVNGAAQWRTGVSGASFSVTPFGNGWFRFTATITDNGSGNNAVAVEVRPAFAATYSPTISAAATGSIFVYGAQIEIGSAATSYMPTGATAFTRSADSAAFTIPSGVTKLRYVFDNDTVQDVAVAAGAYTIPTNLNRPIIKAILGLAY
jgi:hypothetical protein